MQIARRWFVTCFILFLFALLLFMIQQPVGDYQNLSQIHYDPSGHIVIFREGNNWRGLTNEQKNSLSKLGEILYLDAKYPNISIDKKYSILIWKHGKNLERRHIFHYSKRRYDPFEKCPVNNCRITYSANELRTADLVLFHLHRTTDVGAIPKRIGNTTQIWTFLTDESPFNTFLHSKSNTIKNYDGLFNWSMTYRMDSDIPVPYGRTLLLTNETEELDFYAWNRNKKQDVLIAIMGSNCGGRNHRWKYVAELKKHIRVDVYGNCGTLKCPGHFTKDCPIISKYKFYLSFENSNCPQYITEKLWWNGYHKNSVPIVMGGSSLIYNQLLPPRSYINVEDFASPKDLANYIIYLNNTDSELADFFLWKKQFRVVNEHGYFGSDSFHYCRICEALNYNNKSYKVYNNLEKFWSKTNCTASTWNVRGR